jgi:hypothetical protein
MDELQYGLEDMMSDLENKPTGRQIRLTSLSSCAG